MLGAKVTCFRLLVLLAFGEVAVAAEEVAPLWFLFIVLLSIIILLC